MKLKSNSFKKITTTFITILSTMTIICATPSNLNNDDDVCYDMGNDTPIICPVCTSTGWKAYGKQIGDTLFTKRIECKLCSYEQEYNIKIKNK